MRKLVIGFAGLLLIAIVGGVLVLQSLLSPESIRAAIEAQLAQALGEPVTVGGASVSVWPSAGITVTDVAIGKPVSLSLKRTAVNTAMRPLFDRRIENAEIIVEDSDVDLAAVMATLDRLGREAGVGSRESSGSRGAEAPAGEPAGTEPAITLVNIRTIAFRNVTVAAGGRRTAITLESSLDGDRLDISNLTAKSDLTTLTASGAIDSLAKRKATLTMTADPLDLDALMAFAQALTDGAGGAGGSGGADGAGGGNAAAVDLTLELKASRGRAAGVDFNGLVSRARITGEALTLEPFGFGIFGGRLDGVVAVDLRGREPALTVKGKLAGIDMDRVMEFAGNRGALTGKLGGTLTVSGSGTDPRQALSRAKGSGQVAITDGRMKGLQLVRAVVLAFGKPDAVQPAEGGEAFSTLGAAFTLAGGALALTDLSFLSRDVDLKGGGEVRLAGSAIDVKARAMLSEDLTRQAGRDLVRYTAEAGRVTVPAMVTGTLASPQVRIDVGNLAERAVTNEINRQIQKQGESLMKGLFDKKKPPQ